MNHSEVVKAFAGSVAQLYERYLVPLIFAPYAGDLAARVALRRPANVLEIAAGTGAVTRELARRLAPEVSITATDLNQPMLEEAARAGTHRPVEWRHADAMALPFADETFDVVVCQFAAMFFPDKAKAYHEARRVLRPGGFLVFSVWDRIEENEFADIVTQTLAEMFPADPPLFMARIPHGYHDPEVILRDLARGGFDRSAQVTTREERSRAETARIPAVAYCEGTPLRHEIEARDPSRLAEASDLATQAIQRRFGPGPVDGRIRAHIFEVRK